MDLCTDRTTEVPVCSSGHWTGNDCYVPARLSASASASAHPGTRTQTNVPIAFSI